MPAVESMMCIKQVTGEDLTQRTDDNEETLRKRLDTYCQQTMPILEFYDKRGLLSKVNASKKPEEVWQQVKAAVEKRK
jgi:adenylate kinase